MIEYNLISVKLLSISELENRRIVMFILEYSSI